MKPIFMFAGVACVLALVIPALSPSDTGEVAATPVALNPVETADDAVRSLSLEIPEDEADDKKTSKREQRTIRWRCTYDSDLNPSNRSCNRKRARERALAKVNDKPKIAKKAKKSVRRRTILVKADEQGHFVINAKLNGRAQKVLLDTGATSVAINEKTARRIGLRLKPKDFKYTAKTANGHASYAIGKIREIRIGGITISNVQAAVMKGKGLEEVLLGMSFLKRLKSVELKGKNLKLTN